MVLTKRSLASRLYVHQGSVVSEKAALTSGTTNLDVTQFWHLQLVRSKD